MNYNRDMDDSVLDIQHLIWDGSNEAHMWQKHRITRAEVEEVVYSPATELKVEGTYQNRYFVTGAKADGTLLVLILAPKGQGIFYPVTAYKADKTDQREYQTWKAGKQR
jgi:uncharacterized DUF497 family protein